MWSRGDSSLGGALPGRRRASQADPAVSDDVISYFKSKEDFFSETKGIISLSYFKSGQDEVSGIAVWESKETLEANAERVQSIMGGLMDFVTAPPEIIEGDLEYQFKGI